MSAPPQQIPPGETPERPIQRRRRRELARRGGLGILAILIVVFAVLNVDDVKVHWIVGSGRAPLIIVIVISLLVGIVLTYFTERLARKRR